MKPQMVKALLFFAIFVFVAFMYTFLHEGGHALIGLLSGGTITAFNVNFLSLDAHVEMLADFTTAQRIANNLAGASLPLLIWLGFMALVSKRANVALEVIKVLSSVIVLSTLLAWMVLPMLYWAGQTPSDDVINFLNNSGVHPLWVTGTAFLIFCAGWVLFWKKIDGLRRELDLFRNPEESALVPSVYRTALAMLSVFVFCGLLAFSANGFRFTAPRMDPFQLPQGYLLVSKISLSKTQDQAQSMVCSFSLTKAGMVGVYLLIENIQSEYFDVKLTGPGSYKHSLIHAEGYTAGKDAPRMESNLEPGQYTCVLNSRRSAGTLSIFTNIAP